MKLLLHDSPLGDKTVGEVEVADAVFAVPYNEALVHQVFVAYGAHARAGTKAQKRRSDVRGGGRKPRRQKGTGQARLGTIRSPLLRGGGVTFAARPRDFSKKVNRKAYRSAVRSILSGLVREERLRVVQEFSCDEPKTKLLAERLGKEKWLVVTEALLVNLTLAARNLPRVVTMAHHEINPRALLNCDRLLVTGSALKAIEERLT